MNDYVIGETTSLREALAVIDKGGVQLALVVDGDGRLVGTLSDGDARRALLNGAPLDARAADFCNRSARTVRAGTTDREILALMKSVQIHQVPVIDEAGRVVELKLFDALVEPAERPNIVILMVGGRGERLGNLTQSLPKPMLPVGGRPLLETIIGNFRDKGFRRFRLAINFMGEVIEEHFGDGSRFGCSIDYIRETQPLGTAGALALHEPDSDHPILVSNGDLITEVDPEAILQFHLAQGADATMAVREYEFQVPYGVVSTEGQQVTSIEEKPVRKFLISGGIYVLSPDVLSLVPRGQRYDMPALFSDVVGRGGTANAYRTQGYWIDIGRYVDYEQAQRDFEEIFS